MGERGPMKLRIVSETGEDDGTAQSRIPIEPPERPLGLPAEVDELWDDVVDTLTNAGLVTKADSLTLEMALRHFAIARKSSNALIEDGTTVPDPVHGGVKKAPGAQVFKDNSAAFLEYAKQLGLSFAARTRITMPKEGGDNADAFTPPWAANG